MKTLFFIALGGMVGASGRHGVSVLCARLFGHGFPVATMAVNIFGSFLMGLLVGYGLYHNDLSQEAKMFLMVGCLGSFTTFSTFSLDVVTLFQRGDVMQAGLYLLGSVVLSIAGLLLGFYFSKIVGAA